MKRSSKILLVTAVAAGLVTSAALAGGYGYGPGGCERSGAGYGAGPMSGQGMGYGGMHHGPRHDGRFAPAAYGDRLERMRAGLELSAEQEPAWQAFSAKLEAQREAMAEHRETMRESVQEGATAVELAERRVQWMGQRLAAMTELSEAVKSFYAQLTPEQQQRFDRLPLGGGHRGMHRPF
ncbi:MAG TPA: Spy/CpxP family protein refolding chaperone [Gammaproteobacteria bacterium]